MFSVKKQMYHEGLIYSSIGNRVVMAELGVPKFRTYLRINGLSILNFSQFYNRLLRHGIHSFYKINREIDCIVIKRKILFYRNRRLLNSVVLKHGSRPLRQGIIYAEDHIIYSEYHGNKNRKPIHVYRYDFRKDKKEILLTFENIRHVHFIQRSRKNPDVIFIGTGDLDQECAIYRLHLAKMDLDKIGGGSQTWRAVSILETDTELIWGTDDPYNQNYLVRFSLRSKKLEKLREIAGPAYYSTRTINDEMFLATTVEDRRRHKAVIYHSSDGTNWDVYRTFRKDPLHSKYFGYGTIEFIHGQEKLSNVEYNLNGLF